VVGSLVSRFGVGGTKRQEALWGGGEKLHIPLPQTLRGSVHLSSLFSFRPFPAPFSPSGFIFLFHPALGPLWDVIAQKVRGGAVMDGSELVLEVAEARLMDVTIDGSLLVHADAVTGRADEAGRLHFGSDCGRVHLMNVTVQNVGVDWHHPGNVYWRHQVQRHECCRIVLRGRSEFEAYDVKITGDQVGGPGPDAGVAWCFSFLLFFLHCLSAKLRRLLASQSW